MDQEIPFLDVLIKRHLNNSFSTSIYRKKTFTGLYTQWDSFSPRKYKINLIRTFTYRCLRICSSLFLLQSALDDLKRHLSRNGHPRGIISDNMNDVVNKHRNKPKDIITVPKKEICIVLPCLGIQSKILTQQLKSCIYKFYGCFNPKIIFRNTRRIKSFSPIKTDSTAPLGLKKFLRLAAGIVMIATLERQNVDGMTGKRNTSKR